VGVRHQRCIAPLPTVHKKCSADKGTEEKDNLTRNEGSTATGNTTSRADRRAGKPTSKEKCKAGATSTRAGKPRTDQITETTRKTKWIIAMKKVTNGNNKQNTGLKLDQ
jgi:hypothetical protein